MAFFFVLFFLAKFHNDLSIVDILAKEWRKASSPELQKQMKQETLLEEIKQSLKMEL